MAGRKEKQKRSIGVQAGKLDIMTSTMEEGEAADFRGLVAAFWAVFDPSKGRDTLDTDVRWTLYFRYRACIDSIYGRLLKAGKVDFSVLTISVLSVDVVLAVTEVCNYPASTGEAIGLAGLWLTPPPFRVRGDDTMFAMRKIVDADPLWDDLSVRAAYGKMGFQAPAADEVFLSAWSLGIVAAPAKREGDAP